MQFNKGKIIEAYGSVMVFVKEGLKSSNKNEGWKLIRYLLTGGTAALFDWAVYWFLVVYFDIKYLIAALFSFILATIINYALSANWVFKNNRKYSRFTELLLVFTVSAFGLVINQVCLYFLIEIALIHFMLAKVMATGIVFFWNYFSRKYYIFNNN
jgi:putative flippase GtrA